MTNEIYREAVTRLMNEQPNEAVELLAQVPEADLTPAARLALAKAHLLLRDGPAAARLLGELEASGAPANGSSPSGYVRLLKAYAIALSGDDAGAQQLAEGVASEDRRLEHASRALCRQIEGKETLSIVF